MKRRILLWLVLVCLLSAAVSAAEALILQQSIAEKTLRLHVVANSDNQRDQTLKLLVRDAVLCRVECLTEGCTTAREAEQVICRELPAIRTAAEQALEDVGVLQKVQVSFGPGEFFTRNYGTFDLPAGTYATLRVELGKGEGRNWWCVVFPSLCTAATADTAAVCAAGGFDDEETRFITGGEETYTYRFVVLEWIEKFLSLF